MTFSRLYSMFISKHVHVRHSLISTQIYSVIFITSLAKQAAFHFIQLKLSIKVSRLNMNESLWVLSLVLQRLCLWSISLIRIILRMCSSSSLQIDFSEEVNPDDYDLIVHKCSELHLTPDGEASVELQRAAVSCLRKTMKSELTWLEILRNLCMFVSDKKLLIEFTSSVDMLKLFKYWFILTFG